jgi:crotonobetainyl-CoA:carnitine CoA-transferase CaiB-like acyl-CoA transferase
MLVWVWRLGTTAKMALTRGQQMLTQLGLNDRELPSQNDRAGWAQLKALIAAKFKQRGRDEWTEVFACTDACVTPVLTSWEAHQHPHIEHGNRSSRSPTYANLLRRRDSVAPP